MLRPAPLKLILLAGIIVTTTVVVAAFFVWRSGEPRVYILQTPSFGEAPIDLPARETAEVPAKPASSIRIGSFEPPIRVPEYEILEEKTVDADDTHAIRLLLDTRARKESDFVLISRDIKFRYADYDAVSVEFTDTEDLLDYEGGALIFNTPRGATYMGFIYGPPNTKGYYVRAAD